MRKSKFLCFGISQNLDLSSDIKSAFFYGCLFSKDILFRYLKFNKH